MLDELSSIISQMLERLDEFQAKNRSEADTKAGFIEPVLRTLKWGFNEVEREYKVFGGDSVDYALKILGTPKIFIEAKKLDESLDNDKWIKQLSNYIANTGGMKWGILTNGNEYRLYKGDESGLHPPDRIVFQVSIKDCENDEKRTSFIEMIKHLSKDNVESGELDRWASELFLEKRIRKIMLDPSEEFLNAVKEEISTGTDEKIKAAMKNILKIEDIIQPKPDPKPKSKGIKEFHDQASQELSEIFDEFEKFTLSLDNDVQKKETKYYYAYRRNKNFACVEIHPQAGTILIYLKIDHQTLDPMPDFARDVSDIGHFGTGDLELKVSKFEHLEIAKPLIKKSYEIS